MLQTSTLKFLRELQKNNNKPWFDANRKAYEAAKADFSGFVQMIIDKHGKHDPSIAHLAAKDCTFRINRDVRFIKDKSPYKNNMGAYMSKDGKKGFAAGYYFHMQPGGSFCGGGLYMPPPELLKNVRQEIDYNWKEFYKIINSKKFKAVFGDLSTEGDMKLARPPKGYEVDNPAIEYIKLKSWVGTQAFSDADLISKDLVKKVTANFETLQPLIAFLNEGLHAGE
jgi:uncharacterized protein (TIGR02453 family)